MRFFLFLLTLISLKSFADTSANCTLVKGVYENSREIMHDIRFETIADVFSFSNARAFSFNLEGEELRFLRSSIEVNKQIRAIYLLKKNGDVVRAIHMMIDRTPQLIAREKEFYGNMIISQKISGGDWTKIESDKSLRYNFFCRF